MQHFQNLGFHSVLLCKLEILHRSILVHRSSHLLCRLHVKTVFLLGLKLLVVCQKNAFSCFSWTRQKQMYLCKRLQWNWPTQNFNADSIYFFAVTEGFLLVSHIRFKFEKKYQFCTFLCNMRCVSQICLCYTLCKRRSFFHQLNILPCTEFMDGNAAVPFLLKCATSVFFLTFYSSRCLRFIHWLNLNNNPKFYYSHYTEVTIPLQWTTKTANITKH